jgi:hypothetical protein
MRLSGFEVNNKLSVHWVIFTDKIFLIFSAKDFLVAAHAVEVKSFTKRVINHFIQKEQIFLSL